jgi:hypothetical protein
MQSGVENDYRYYPQEGIEEESEEGQPRRTAYRDADATSRRREPTSPGSDNNTDRREAQQAHQDPNKPAKAPTQKAEKSLSRRLKEIVVVEPRTTIDDLYDRLVAEGFVGRSKVTIATLRSDALTTLQAAVDAGLFPAF